MVSITREALLRQLRDRAKKYNTVVAQESILKSEKKPLRDGIVHLLNELGVDTITLVGLKVSLTTQPRTIIDEQLAKKFLDAATLAKISVTRETETLRVTPVR